MASRRAIPGIPTGAGAPETPTVEAQAAVSAALGLPPPPDPRAKVKGVPKLHIAAIDEDTVVRVGIAIELGASQRFACMANGVTPRRWRKWVKQGQEVVQRIDDAYDAGKKPPKLTPGEHLAMQAYETASQAEGKFVLRNLGFIAKHAPDTWQAAMASLERKYPHLYANRTRMEHTGAGGKPLQMMAPVIEIHLKPVGPAPVVVNAGPQPQPPQLAAGGK